MKVKLWGVRGSIPCPTDPYHSNSRYGGESICVQVWSESTDFIIDAGSGIRRLGFELMKGPCGKGAGEVHIFMTHFHWDHIIGLLFFVPIFIPGNKIHIHAVQDGLFQFVHTLFSAPYFPVEYEHLGAEIIYHQLKPRQQIPFGDIHITPYLLDHPNEAWGYRIEHEGKTYSHCSDTEALRSSEKELGEDLPLYKKVDLMFFDGQYLMNELLTTKKGWGHASPNVGIDMAIRFRIKHIVFGHHDPSATDDDLIQQEHDIYKYIFTQMRQFEKAGKRFPGMRWEFARQDKVYEL